MKKFLLPFLSILLSIQIAGAQTPASDFTVTSTDGATLNLYNALNANKTIMMDFFFTTCSYCIQYAPIIETAYQAHGAGNQQFDIWGIDNGDNTAAVAAYRTAHSVSNPCAAGTDGGANAVTTTYSSGTFGSFTGWPTYTIICPDKHVFWDVNYPPSATGFDSYLTQCSTAHSVGISTPAPKDLYSKIYSAFPNPAVDETTVSFGLGAESTVVFEIYNLLGQKVLTHDAGSLGSGYHMYTLSLSNLNSGTYFIKMNIDNNRFDNLMLSIIK